MSFVDEVMRKTNTDEWYTPKQAVELILPYARGKVWCPFDTDDSYFPRVFREHGLEVENTHIFNGYDFFEYEPKAYDCIISNPPYSKRQAVLERLYKLGKPFAMLLNVNGIFDNRKRFQLFKDNGVQLLIPYGRIGFFQFEETEKSSPNFQSIYVCQNLLPRDIVFAD
jgi:hypothetical protein